MTSTTIQCHGLGNVIHMDKIQTLLLNSGIQGINSFKKCQCGFYGRRPRRTPNRKKARLKFATKPPGECPSDR